jgi:hypothetical protein
MFRGSADLQFKRNFHKQSGSGTGSGYEIKVKAGSGSKNNIFRCCKVGKHSAVAAESIVLMDSVVLEPWMVQCWSITVDSIVL